MTLQLAACQTRFWVFLVHRLQVIFLYSAALQSGSKCRCPASFRHSCPLQMQAHGSKQQQVSILLL